MFREMSENLSAALRELFEIANPEQGQVLVVGCSTSEVLGKMIGTSGSEQCAAVLFETIAAFSKTHMLSVAAQCCEHLNRAIVVERDTADQKGLTIVSAIPYARAGGAFAAEAFRKMKRPVLVESISAHLGVDIGNTLIGMHLKQVAVPVRTSVTRIGKAPVVFAMTRPKYIGGERAKYL